MYGPRNGGSRRLVVEIVVVGVDHIIIIITGRGRYRTIIECVAGARTFRIGPTIILILVVGTTVRNFLPDPTTDITDTESYLVVVVVGCSRIQIDPKWITESVRIYFFTFRRGRGIG